MSEPQERYGAQRVRHSLLHFAVGKSLGAVIGLAWLLTLVRVMPEVDYGAYFTFYAYIEVMLLLSAWGSVQLMERFVPELHEQRRDGQVLRLAGSVLILRGLLLIATAALALLLQEPLLNLMGLQAQAQAFVWANGLLLAEGLCRTVDSFHDGLLMQRKSQLSVLFRNGVKLLALLLMAMNGSDIGLQEWLPVELGLMVLALIWSGWLYHGTRSTLSRPVSETDAALEWRRYWRYALYIFACQLVWLLTSFDALKILVNRSFGLELAALLGFCLALVLVVQRYLPTYLLVGMVRPLFIVAQQHDDRADRLRCLSALFFKLNLALLLPLLCLGLVYEDAALALASGGKFDAGEGVLTLLLALLIVQALKNCQALVQVALEDGRGALVGSAAAAGVFFLAAAALYRMGVQGLLLSLLLGESVSAVVQHWRAGQQGVRLYVPFKAWTVLAIANALALAIAVHLSQMAGLSTNAELGVATLACAAATLAVLARAYFDASEWSRIRSVLPAGLMRRLGMSGAEGA